MPLNSWNETAFKLTELFVRRFTVLLRSSPLCISFTYHLKKKQHIADSLIAYRRRIEML